MSITLTTPVGRIVQGNPYDLNDKKDQNNQPVIGKDGKPVKSNYFALAIRKNPGETHWASTVWGRLIWDEGNKMAPAQAQLPSFAWKVEDGDSQIPNKKGKKNFDREDFRGCWIVKCSSSFAPKTYTLIGQQQPVALLEPGAIQTGYFVQVSITVDFNKRTDSPGVYLNPNIVCLIAYGQVIQGGVDVTEAGFGGAAVAALPPGASAVPLAGMAVSGAPPAPTAVHQPPPPVVAPPAPQAVYQPPPPPVVPPHSAISAAAPPPPPAAPTPDSRLTAKAAGQTYAAWIAAGWTDALLVQHGYMTP